MSPRRESFIVRVQSLTLVAAGAALLAPALLPAARPSPLVAVREGTRAPRICSPRSVTRVPVSKGRYRSDARSRAEIAVCGARGAVFWKADMDIDCDGRPGLLCNGRTDPLFSGPPRTSSPTGGI